MNILEMMIDSAYETAIKRDVYGPIPSKDISQKLKEEVLELDDSFLENRISDINEFKKIGISDIETFKDLFEKLIKDSQGDELADIVIVCLAASKKLNINLQKHIEAKLKYNEVR